MSQRPIAVPRGHTTRGFHAISRGSHHHITAGLTQQLAPLGGFASLAYIHAWLTSRVAAELVGDVDVVGRGPEIAIPAALEPTDDMSALWGMTLALPNCSERSEDADPKAAADIAEAGLVRVQALFQLLDLRDPDPELTLDGGAARREAVTAARRAALARASGSAGPSDAPGGGAR